MRAWDFEPEESIRVCLTPLVGAHERSKKLIQHRNSTNFYGRKCRHWCHHSLTMMTLQFSCLPPFQINDAFIIGIPIDSTPNHQYHYHHRYLSISYDEGLKKRGLITSSLLSTFHVSDGTLWFRFDNDTYLKSRLIQRAY